MYVAIIVFIGHGSNPPSSQMPPSSDKDTGRLIFLSRKSQLMLPGQYHAFTQANFDIAYDDLTDFQLPVGKTLFICQACYSGNTVNKMTKSN